MFPRGFEHLRTKWLFTLLVIVSLLTVAVLALVQFRMRAHVWEDLASSLNTDAEVYTKVEEAQRQQAEQSVALIANLPSLKALMSTHDITTIQDGSESILRTTAADLLTLEDADGEMLALHSAGDNVPGGIAKYLLLGSRGKHDWWRVNGRLYSLTFAPIVSGPEPDRRFLGRVGMGREVAPQSVAGPDALKNRPLIFERDGSVLASSLDPSLWPDFQYWMQFPSKPSQTIQEVEIGGEVYLLTYIELAGDHPVRLYSLRSYDQATSFLRSLNQLLLAVGIIAIGLGALLGFVLSRQITRPLEDLVSASRHMEKGDFEFPIHAQGKDEVAELTRAFVQMRKSLVLSREGMLRSARLEAVGRLSGGIAHDFNNLIMIIKGYSDLLSESVPAESKPHLEEIVRATERASGLTRQLLAFSRKQVLEAQVFDLNHTVRGMLKMLRLLLGEDVELLTSLPEKIGRVKADPGQIEQVIMNLAVNARDAMPGRGKLIIETQNCRLDETYASLHQDVTPGPYVMLAVTDSGCGMNSETLAQIFEPFFTTKEPGKGTGLGLATVYGVVKQSRGHINVYSEINVGTTFKVYLPAVDQPALSPRNEQLNEVVKGSATVLLVEDEVSLRTLSARALQKLGYEVLQAGNGAEGLVVAERHPGTIHVVVTDVVMPKMGGPELVEKLREKRSDFAVIFMSGYTEAAALENTRIGTDAVLLNKPFATETLVRRIAQACEGTKSASIGKTGAVADECSEPRVPPEEVKSETVSD